MAKGWQKKCGEDVEVREIGSWERERDGEARALRQRAVTCCEAPVPRSSSGSHRGKAWCRQLKSDPAASQWEEGVERTRVEAEMHGNRTASPVSLRTRPPAARPLASRPAGEFAVLHPSPPTLPFLQHLQPFYCTPDKPHNPLIEPASMRTKTLEIR